MVGDRFRLNYQLTQQDYQAYFAQAAKRARARGFMARFSRPLIGGLLFGLLLLALDKADFLTSRDIKMLIGGALAGVLLVGTLAIFINRKMVGRMVGSHDTLTGKFTLAAYDGGGIQITGKQSTANYDWAAFLDLSDKADMIVMWIDNGAGVLLPSSAFTDDTEKREFVDFVKERIESHKRLGGAGTKG